jgi:hypothetical protein
MQDANAYRQFADDCIKLARSMPQHRATLEGMAATWRQLADAAEKEKEKAGGRGCAGAG